MEIFSTHGLIQKLDLLRLRSKYWSNSIGISSRQFYLLTIFIISGILYRYIANDNYLLCTENGLSIQVNKDQCSKGIKALIPYSAHTIDKKNRSVGPFDKQDISSLYYRHWLGTDLIGRDILAGLIWGSNIALKVGLFASLLSLIIGLFFGYLSGYIGDDTFKVYKWQLLITMLLLMLSIFYFLYASGLARWFFVAALIIWTIYLSAKNESYDMGKQKIAIPFDHIISRVIEVFKAVPIIFIVLVLVSLFRHDSLTNVIIIIAIIKWPIIARFLRAEILKLKKSDHVVAAKTVGLSPSYIFRKNILPLAISPILISLAFGFSGTILLEAVLSFLGIGIPVDQVTWGSILNEARSDFSSWWLALFPGIAIYLTIRLFHSMGNSINEKLIGVR